MFMNKENLSLVYLMIENGITEKETFHPVLEKCDKDILQYLSKINFKESPHMELFRYTTDERLDQIKEKIKKAEEHPEFVIQEVIKEKMELFRNFLAKYHIGFVKEAKLLSSGYVQVELPCMITPSFASEKAFSKQKVFEMQLDFLKENGFILDYEKNHGNFLVNCEQNLKAITKLLQNRGGKHIQILTWEKKVDKVTFIVSLADLDKFNEEPISFELEETDLLNADEIAEANKTIREIFTTISSLNFVGDKMTNTCGSLVESYFSRLCEIFNFNGTVRRNKTAKFIDERNKNIEIRELENSVANALSPEKVMNFFKAIEKNISDFTCENINFNPNHVYFDRYGFLNLELSYITNPIFCMIDNAMPEEKLKEAFETNNGNQEDENLYVLDTYKNKKTIMEILKSKYPSSNIREMNVSVRDNEFFISKIIMHIDNISDVL